jgi:aromatic ring hydroxylase
MKLRGIADVLYGAYNRHDAAAVAELYDANGTHEDIALGHSKVGQTAIADGLQKFFGWFPDAHWAPHVQIADPFGSVTITYLLSATLQAQMGRTIARGQRISLRGAHVLHVRGGSFTAVKTTGTLQRFRNNSTLNGAFNMRTGQEYLESLRDGRKVYVGGDLIEDITTHPKTKGYAHAIAEYYDLHLDPKNQDVATFVDTNGNRQSMHWFLPRSKEDVVRRRKYCDFICRHFKGGIFTRPPVGMNAVMFTQVDDQKPWAENSRFKNGTRDLSKNIQRQWEEVTSKDLAISPMFLDVQFDRGRDNAIAETPMLKIVEERDDGNPGQGLESYWDIGAICKPPADWQFVAPGPDTEQTVYALVPIATRGISVVARKSNAERDADPFDRPLATIGDELDAMVYFDDVLIPWPQVQHIGNPDHAKWYPQRQFDWIHLETQIRHCVHAELMVGLALLLTQSLGTGSGPVVQAQLAELIRFRETCRAFMLAAEETGFVTPGGSTSRTTSTSTLVGHTTWKTSTRWSIC